jgi:bifunctional N-acetylglucosamine-1-phosphate-uridyltransferase/glucosamine-1-phosphate-acetyltransferase GlmU-like protein
MMNFKYPTPSAVIRQDSSYRQFGHADKSDTGTGHAATIDLQFRQATNGVIVNTLVNDEPLITTSAGQF